MIFTIFFCVVFLAHNVKWIITINEELFCESSEPSSDPEIMTDEKQKKLKLFYFQTIFAAFPFMYVCTYYCLIFI